MQKVTDPGKQRHKQKTNNDQIHEIAYSRWQGEKPSRLGIKGEYAHRRMVSSSGGC